MPKINKFEIFQLLQSAAKTPYQLSWNNHYAIFMDINTLHVIWIVLVELNGSGPYISWKLHSPHLKFCTKADYFNGNY